jgi:hypothetical protein
MQVYACNDGNLYDRLYGSKDSMMRRRGIRARSGVVETDATGWLEGHVMMRHEDRGGDWSTLRTDCGCGALVVVVV